MPPFLTLLQFHSGLHSDLGCIYLTGANAWCKLIVTIICLKHSTPHNSSCRGGLPCTERWRSHTSIIDLSSAALCHPGLSRHSPLVAKSSLHITSLVGGMLQARRVDRFSRYFGSHDLRFQISISKLSEILICTSHDLDLSDYTIHIFCSLCLTESRKACTTLEKNTTKNMCKQLPP